MTERSRDDPPEGLARRRLLSRLTWGVGVGATALVAAPSVGFLLGLRKVPNVWRTACRLDDVPVGATIQVSFLDPSPLPWSGVTARTAAWLRRTSDTDVVAFSVNCTHLGCPVRWIASADLFMCPCHGGVFYRDGTVASGPPRRHLWRYPVRTVNDQVEILTSALPIE